VRQIAETDAFLPNRFLRAYDGRSANNPLGFGKISKNAKVLRRKSLPSTRRLAKVDS
jgi:hypothetical protein